MCGRFANNETIPVLAGRWAAAIADGAADWRPSDDVRPSQRVPALLGGAMGRRLGLMAWGWSRDFARSGLLINARSEEAARKPTFSEAFARRRCLLPAEAWFEWQTGDGGKRKHRLRPAGLDTWALAGLWEPVVAPDGGRSAAVVVLTTTAHASVAAIHERMPCLVATAAAEAWLEGGAAPPPQPAVAEPC